MRLYHFAFVLFALAWGHVLAQPAKPPKVQGPWMDKTLPPDKRADMLIAQMTLDEKIQLVHGTGWGAMRPGAPVPPGSNEGAGFVPGIERLGIPPINMADSAVGVRMAAGESRYATLLPSTLGAAASFDPEAAFLYGSVIGRELRDPGYNMSLGGGGGEPLCHAASIHTGCGGQLRSRGGISLWLGDRPRAARPGLQHVHRRRRGSHPRAPQRAQFRICRRRSHTGRNHGRPTHERLAGPAGDGRH